MARPSDPLDLRTSSYQPADPPPPPIDYREMVKQLWEFVADDGAERHALAAIPGLAGAVGQQHLAPRPFPTNDTPAVIFKR